MTVLLLGSLFSLEYSLPTSKPSNAGSLTLSVEAGTWNDYDIYSTVCSVLRVAGRSRGCHDPDMVCLGGVAVGVKRSPLTVHQHG